MKKICSQNFKFFFLKWCGTFQKKLLLAFNIVYLNKNMVFLYMI